MISYALLVAEQHNGGEREGIRNFFKISRLIRYLDLKKEMMPRE
jgi:hypothetical protein